MKKALLAAPAIAGVIALSACGHGISAGVVIGKHVVPAHSYTWYMSMPCGKGCFTMIPETGFKGTEYVLDLRDGKRTGSVDTDQATYDRENVGDAYPGGSK